MNQTTQKPTEQKSEAKAAELLKAAVKDVLHSELCMCALCMDGGKRTR